MPRLRKHYIKLLKLNKKDYHALSDQMFLEQYQFCNDIDLLLKEHSVTIDEQEYQGQLTGIFRTRSKTFYRMEWDGVEIFFEGKTLGEGEIVDETYVLQELHRQYEAFRENETKSCIHFSIFAAIVFIAIGLIVAFTNQERLFIDFDTDIVTLHKDASGVYDTAADAVVLIEVYATESNLASSATGMIVSEDGYLISCAHIYDDIPAAKFKVIMGDGTIYNAVFVAGDVEADISLLKIVNADRKFTTVQFTDSSTLEHGQDCVVLGFPGGVSVKPMVTSGIISSTSVSIKNALGYNNNFIQTDAIANPGNSGGGLFNMKGQVVGIVTSKYVDSRYEGTIYSIPSSTIKEVVNDLFYKGFVVRPTLGITVSYVTNKNLDDGYPYGCWVVETAETSNAHGLLTPNDIITKMNGIEITRQTSLLDVINMTMDENNLTAEIEVYDVAKKAYRTISFNATIRVSQSGYIPDPLPSDTNNGSTSEETPQE